jgi:cytochrome P450 family 142 subfamily A polypeptide 1
MLMTQIQDNRTLPDMHLMDPEILQCPYHYDKTLREEAPVYQDPTSGVYVVSTYELVREAHKTPAVFSNEFGLAAGSSAAMDPDIKAAIDSYPDTGKGTLLTIDDPQHKIYRDAVKNFFTADNFKGYEPWIRDLAKGLVDQLASKSKCDFIEEFARPLPLQVIMHVLGMPLEMFDQAFKWTVNNVTVLSQMADKETLIDAHAGVKQEYEWFEQALAERKGKPVEDLIGLVANTEYEGRPTTLEEQLAYCTQFLVAGNETTTATLAEGMRQLCLHPAEARKIRDDRSLIPNLVDESLRLASPTSNMWRLTTSDYELGGVTIPARSMVLLKYFSSNHDESMFEDPLKFDVTRANVKRHIAFGFGAHVCIGQHLSRLEMIVAWEELFARLDNFQLATSDDELEYMPNILLRALEEIPISYDVVG